MENAIVKNVKAAIDLTSDRYKKSLKSAFPAFKNRLQERNLTFNFASYYMHSQETDDIDVWQEVPIKKKESEKKEDYSQHIDTVIIDKKNKSMIFIEAKCISRNHVKPRLKAMYEDLDRLYNIADIDNESLSICGGLEKYYKEEGYDVYFLIIANIWKSTTEEADSQRYKIINGWKPIDFIKGEKEYSPIYSDVLPSKETNDIYYHEDKIKSKNGKEKGLEESHHIVYALYKYPKKIIGFT